MFYLALESFIPYLPYALPTKAVSSGIVAGVDRTVGDPDIPDPAAASLDDRRYTAALLQQAVEKRLAEKFL